MKKAATKRAPKRASKVTKGRAKAANAPRAAKPKPKAKRKPRAPKAKAAVAAAD